MEFYCQRRAVNVMPGNDELFILSILNKDILVRHVVTSVMSTKYAAIIICNISTSPSEAIHIFFLKPFEVPWHGLT